jgi:hypothetical protein
MIKTALERIKEVKIDINKIKMIKINKMRNNKSTNKLKKSKK